MPIEPIGDLDVGRRIADEFAVTLARDADRNVRVLVSCALVGGDTVIGNWSAEDITDQLSVNQQATVEAILRSAEIKVETLLGL